MTITRHELLEIAGMTVGAFKPLAQRDQVPRFRDGPASGYFPIEALMLAASEIIARETGYGRSDIKNFVEFEADAFVGLASSDHVDDLYMLVLRVGEGRSIHFGSREELWQTCVNEWAQPWINGLSAQYPESDRPWTAVSMFYVGAIVKGIRERAERLGIDLASECQ